MVVAFFFTGGKDTVVVQNLIDALETAVALAFNSKEILLNWALSPFTFRHSSCPFLHCFAFSNLGYTFLTNLINSS